METNNTLKKSTHTLLQKFVLGLIIILLAAGTAYFYIKYSKTNKALQEAREELQMKNLNQQVVNFAYLFVEDVLKAQGEVDLQTRSTLENAVRNLNDDDILAQWQKFTGSTTEKEAQTEAANLLEKLILKIKK